MTPCIIFGSLNAAKTIAQYFGLIESVDSSIRKLLHQQFIAAQNSLGSAQTATEEMRSEYLKSALNSFNMAIAVEGNENLISSYVGLAMCQYLLGDVTNAKMSLEKAKLVELQTQEKVKAGVKGYAKEALKNLIPGRSFFSMKKMFDEAKKAKEEGREPVLFPDMEKRKKEFNEYKQKATAIEFQH